MCLCTDSHETGNATRHRCTDEPMPSELRTPDLDTQPGERRLMGLVFLLVLLSVGLWVHPYRAQQASRYALTAAVADQGTIVLDDYEGVIGIDRAVRDGTIYSDKAPGQPFAAVPFYLGYRAVGGEDARRLQIDGNVGLWWQTFWFASVPLAVLAVLMYTESRRSAAGALGGTVALVFGTLLLPFGALLFGHVLAAALVYAAWVVLNRITPPSLGRLGAVGGLIGAAVIVEYTAGIAGTVIFIISAARAQWRSLAVLLGGLPFAVLLGWYNARAFGNPWTVSYSFSAFDEVTATARPVTSLFGAFRLDNLVDVFFSQRGFLLASPIVIIALVASVWLVLRGEHRTEGVLATVLFLLYLLIPLFWGNPWGGDSPGPRYMVTALPFLVVPAAVAYERFRRPTLLAVLVSVVTMLAAMLTDPMLERSGDYGLNVWARWVADGVFVPNVIEVALGAPRVPAMLGILAAAGVTGLALVRAHRAVEASRASVTG